LMHARIEREQGELVVEVNVRDDRKDTSLHQLRKRLCRALVRDGDPCDLAAGLLQSRDLLHRGLEVVGERGAHRLDADRRAAADGRAPDVDALGHAARTRAEVTAELELDGLLHYFQSTCR